MEVEVLTSYIESNAIGSLDFVSFAAVQNLLRALSNEPILVDIIAYFLYTALDVLSLEATKKE